MINMQDVTSALAANPLLTAGMGGIAFAAASRVLRAGPSFIGMILGASCTTSVRITSRYAVFDDVVRYLGHHVLPWSGRSLAPIAGIGTLTTGYGSGLARYGNVLVFYRRTIDTGQNSYQSETLDMRFLCRDRGVPLRFVREALRTDKARNIRIRVIENEHGGERIINRPKRLLASVHIDAKVKDRVVSAFRTFIAGERDYLARGVPYRFCGVLYGLPGTGKTSLIHALASELDLTIVYASTLEGIGRVAGRCGLDDILVIEDIDSMANGLDRTGLHSRVEVAMDGTPPLHALLNALDGFCTPHGLKVVVTTNHVDRLDPALLRPGRADLLVEIGLLHDRAIREMFAARHGAAAAAQLDRRRLQPMTGALLQQILQAHGDPDDAAAALMHQGLPPRLVQESGA